MRLWLRSSSYRQNLGFTLKVLAAVLSILLVSGIGQRNQTFQQDTQSTSVSGTVLTFSNDIGAISASFEYVITGTPATVSIVASGCMRSGTCDTLETYTTVANSIRKPNGSGIAYDNYQISVTFTGGTNPSVKVNRLTTLARAGAPAGTVTNGGVALTTNCLTKAGSAIIIACSSGSDDGTTVTFTDPNLKVGSGSNNTSLQVGDAVGDFLGIVSNWRGGGGQNFGIDASVGTLAVFGINTGSAFKSNIGGTGIYEVVAGASRPQTDNNVTSGDASHRWSNTFTTAVTGITAFLTSLYTNATTTFSSVTGLSFPVSANQNYKIRCDLDYQVSVNTTDLKIQWTGPASPTFLVYDLDTAVTGSTLSASVNPATATTTGAFSTALSEAGTPTATTNFPFTTSMTLINGANAGTVQLQAAATAAGTVSILPGSCVVTQ